MRSQPFLLLVITGILFTGCIGRQAFYVSPFNGANNPYHTIPLKHDSIQSAFYINALLTRGAANDNKGDIIFAGYSNISQSLNFGDFQAFYGIGFSLGSYNVDRFESTGNNATVDPVAINANAGNKAFSGYGFDGGINFTIPFKNGEWRAIGIETSLRKEFGDYLAFRKGLPNTAATLIIRNDSYVTAGGYSDIIGYSGDVAYGLKLGFGSVLNKEYKQFILDSDVVRSYVKYNYANVTFHVSKKKWTGFLQFNEGGKASNILLGSNYRLGK